MRELVHVDQGALLTPFGPRARFYADCPLKLPDGNMMGTVCLIDTRPRAPDGNKINLLQAFGRLAEIELERGSRLAPV